MNAREYDNWRTDNYAEKEERREAEIMAKHDCINDIMSLDSYMDEIGKGEEWSYHLFDRLILDGVIPDEDSFTELTKEMCDKLSGESQNFLANVALEIELGY